MKGILSAAVIAFAVSVATAAAPTDSQIKAEVQRQLVKLDPSASHLSVDVRGGVVSLSGSVPSLWLKEEAIRRALKVSGVQSLAAEVDIAKAEDDRALVRAVGDAVRHYDLYTVYDNIDGRVLNGAVRLEGAVTEPKKMTDIVERVAKVRGVQSINNRIEVLPTSDSDNRLRVTIVNAIYRDQAFENYSMVDPPVHVIVNNGHVTLIGFVRSQIELIKAESIARSAFGVLAVDNKVQLVGARAGGR